MDTDTIIRQLEYEEDKHKNDRLFTGQINITAMCRDLIPKMKALKRYEDLEQDGRLLELPCKVGDTVYEVQEIRHRIQTLEIISIYIGRIGEIFFNWELKDGIGIYKNVKGFGMSNLGKTVFLTQEAAEAALKEMEGRA